jgi:cardiolipin synthase
MLMALLFASACVTPQAERKLEDSPGGVAPPQIESARGPLSAARSQAVIEALKARSPQTGIFEHHLAVEEAIAGSPLSVGNKVVLLRDGSATYEAMFAAIGAARDHIHLETYIIDDDEVGQRFAQALAAARARGVLVNLMYDSVGSLNTPKEFFAGLSRAGIEVLEFHPVNPLKGWELNERDHRKLLVVDGRVAFLGGINISDVYSRGSEAPRSSSSSGAQRPWRDTQLQLEGPVVAEIQKTFIEAWRKQAKAPPPLRNAFPPLEPRGKEVVRTLATWGDHPESAIHATLISAISSAEKSVSITMAYFVPDPQFMEAIRAAAARGVDVRLILPGFTDFWAVFHAGRSHYTDLLKSGVHVYERRSRLLHAKTAVIDGVWSTVGSANIDWRSFAQNHELNAVVLGPEFGAQMEAMFARDLDASVAITLESWRDRPITDRVKEAAARVWEHWL